MHNVAFIIYIMRLVIILCALLFFLPRLGAIRIRLLLVLVYYKLIIYMLPGTLYVMLVLIQYVGSLFAVQVQFELRAIPIGFNTYST